jgi:PAS domain S-box-containing protein
VISSEQGDPRQILPRSALGRLVETAVDLMCIVDRQGALRWINPAWQRLLGHTREDLRRDGLLALVHPADVDDTASALEALRERDEEVRFENRLRCRDGSFRWLQWSVVPMRYGAAYGTARDVTERKLAERGAEERTRLLLMAEEVAGLGHWRIDLAADRLTWSNEMYRIHGLDPRTFEPDVERAVEAYYPEDRGEFVDHIRDAILLRKDFEFELRIVRPDGSIRHVLSRGKCEVSDDGRPLAVFGVFQDVTERKQLHERVVHSERMATVGTLAAGVAHEINNPLTWVIANLDAIDRALEGLRMPEASEHDGAARKGLRMPEASEASEHEGEDDGLRASEASAHEAAVPSALRSSIDHIGKMVAEAQQGADQVKRIVRDLLTYSRSQPEQLESVDVQEALDIAVNIATNQFKYRAHLVRDYGHVPGVVADESRLTQVFVNLIVNAAQAIPERRSHAAPGHEREGVIELRTAVDHDGRVRVSVRDNGLGMPEAVKARVFDPFYTTKPVGVGTGLGLSISNNIIKSFHGEIQIESEEGQGTVVSVVLPAAPDGSGTYSMVVDEQPRARVLVVDEAGQLGRPLSRMLSTGYEVVSLRTGRDALSILDGSDRIDVILCDVGLSDMTPMDFQRNVQRVAPALYDRLAFIVGDDLDEVGELLERSGLPYITTPIEPTALRELVERLAG